MTTNGVLLAKRVAELKDAGLDRINISFDIMNPDTFKTITGHGKVDAVLEGIEAALSVFISAISNHFCSKCNRLRLTADGRLRPCLMDDRSIDIKTLLRSNADDQLLIKSIYSAVKLKPEAHLAIPSVHTNMMAIGG